MEPLPGGNEGGRHVEEMQLAKERQAEEEKRIAFLKALEFDGMGSRLATISRAQAKTCDWIFKTPQYDRWRDESNRNEHHGILWMKGKPGAGKSTLMKYVLDIAKERDCSETIVSFFFDARGWPLEKSTEGMYRCLLHQILEGLPHLYSSKTLVTQRGWSIGALENMLQQYWCLLVPRQARSPVTSMHLTSVHRTRFEMQSSSLSNSVTSPFRMGSNFPYACRADIIPTFPCTSMRNFDWMTNMSTSETFRCIWKAN